MSPRIKVTYTFCGDDRMTMTQVFNTLDDLLLAASEVSLPLVEDGKYYVWVDKKTGEAKADGNSKNSKWKRIE